MARDANTLKNKQEESYFEKKNREAILKLQQKQEAQAELPPTSGRKTSITPINCKKEGFLDRLLKIIT